MIQSHTNPYKSLKQHVEEVGNIFNAVLKGHSDLIKIFIDDCIEYVVKFHDLGKAIPEFQKYILNPKLYRGKRSKKAHAPVSLLLWVWFAQENKIPHDVILLVASVVWKHHGDFPVFNDSDGLREALSFYDFTEDFQLSEYPFDNIKNELNLSFSQSFKPDDIDLEDIFDDDYLEQYSIEKAAEIKIRAQLLFSILLESDRAYLALEKQYLKNKYFDSTKLAINPDIVDDFLISKVKSGSQNKILNDQRTKIRKQILSNTSQYSIESVTLPTGLGKTMVAAQWALKHMYESSTNRKVIVVLPFLSIIDQTVKEYKKLFAKYDSEALILEAHSIAERKYKNDDTEDADSEQSNKYNNAVDFLVDTWSNDFVITTFDQFIMSLLSSKGSHLMRFHNLADALIIMDEIQALPTQLWQPLSLALNVVANKLNSKILIMSATQPKFIHTHELVLDPKILFKEQGRYKIVLKHKKMISLESFVSECRTRMEDENWHEKRVLIVLNTRASARHIFDSLEEFTDCNVFFLSSDVTPVERLDKIEQIKDNKPCLVIATQCIEAGVDIDMDFVIRDFAPLDSIIQCSGRCNRNGLKSRSSIELISLVNDKGKLFTAYVYDAILLEKTSAILSTEYEFILEEDIYKIVSAYFNMLKSSKDTGRKHSENWAYWREALNIKKLLRGDSEKINFVVISQDCPKEGELGLKQALQNALEIKDRWVRKRTIRSLGARIAQLTVSVYAHEDFHPDEIAEEIGGFYLLRDEYYIQGRGIDLNLLNENSASLII